MQGADVYKVLEQIGATHIYHANSVTTNCTFLEQSRLLSRGFVEDRLAVRAVKGAQLRLSERSGRPLTEEADGPFAGFQQEGQNKSAIVCKL